MVFADIFIRSPFIGLLLQVEHYYRKNISNLLSEAPPNHTAHAQEPSMRRVLFVARQNSNGQVPQLFTQTLLR